MNIMKKIRIEKVTLNIGCGKDQQKIEIALKLLKNITGAKPTKTITNKRIPEWGIRPGLPVGCKVTLRKEAAKLLLIRLLKAKDNVLSEKNFNDFGGCSFGIAEYIDIADVKYDPEIGIIGLEASITLERPGFRIKKRSQQKKKIPKKHNISKEDAIKFLKDEFKISTGEEE